MTLDFNRLGQDFAAFVADPTAESSVAYAEKMGLKVSHTQDIRGKRYHIVRYDKSKYNNDDTENGFVMTDEIALLRSIIISEGKIRCVSLPKSTKKWEDVPSSSISTTTLLEGPMVNVFYYADDACSGDDVEGKGWQITTRSVFGARNSYFDNDDGSKLTFHKMFHEAADADTNSGSLTFDAAGALDRRHCMSYVVRHPKNRDVYGVDTPTLQQVASFAPRDDSMMVWDYIAPTFSGDIADTTISSMGHTAIWKDADGNLVRAKKLSDEYLNLRKLRGTQPKLKFHYLTLRKQRGAVGNYLAKFPEHTAAFNAFRDQIHDFTKTLQRNYWDCYVKHSKPLSEFDGRYKSHMYNLHSAFKSTNTPQLFPQVIRYVNGLQPPQLMYSLNWSDNRPRRSATSRRSRTHTNQTQSQSETQGNNDMQE